MKRRVFLGSAISLIYCTTSTTLAEPCSELDERCLRNYGARLDGVTDDSDAIQKAIDTAVHLSTTSGRASVAITLPAGHILLNKALFTRGVDFVLRGAGQDITIISMGRGGNGVLIHGKATDPAIGYLELANLSLVDSNSQGSGPPAVFCYQSPTAAQPAMTWQNIAFRKWRTAAKITNCPRNWHCENVTIYGPDFQMQPGAALEINSVGPGGCYSYSFIDVFIVNYMWGWLYNVQSPLEGQRFIACTCYNGWGMVRVTVQNTKTGEQGEDIYRSLLWSFEDCDWQGLGYAFDMSGCRNIRISGGFYIANRNITSLPIPNGRPRRRYFSFINCRDIIMSGVELDVLAQTESTLSLIFIALSSKNIRIHDLIIASYAPIYAVYELENTTEEANFQESGTIYNKWVGEKEFIKIKDIKN